MIATLAERTCALAAAACGRSPARRTSALYWVWAHPDYRLLLREPNVCRVDVSALLSHVTKLGATASRVIAPCDECRSNAPRQCAGAAKPFCMNCGRGL